MKIRQVVVGCAIAVGITVIGLGALVFWLGRVVASSTKGLTQMSPAMKRPAVRSGGGLLSKSVFISDPRLGLVTDIRYGGFERGHGHEIGVAGTDGAVFADTGGAVRSGVTFASRAEHTDILDVEGDGNCEYLDRGSWMSPAVLFDHKGRQLWQSAKRSGVDDCAPGDVNGDGKLEFAVGYNGGGGISLLNAQGKELWHKMDGNVWHVEILDINQDGRPEIVHSNAGGEMTVRNAAGDIYYRAHTAGYFSHFSTCPWPTTVGPTRAIELDTGTVLVINADGSTAAKLSAPDCRQLGNATAVLVTPQPGKPAYLAVLATYDQWSRAVLYVFNSKKQLAYEEVLAEPCASMAAVSLNNAKAESLLLGGNGTVWRYDFATKP